MRLRLPGARKQGIEELLVTKEEEWELMSVCQALYDVFALDLNRKGSILKLVLWIPKAEASAATFGEWQFRISMLGAQFVGNGLVMA